MKVYVWKQSGNSYKLRVLLALLGVDYEEVMVNFRTHEHKSADYLKINPRGQVPAIVDGDLLLWDSAACLVYIARSFGGEQWLPSQPAPMAEVMNWVALSGNEMQFGLQYARRGLMRGICSAGTLEQMQANGRVALCRSCAARAGRWATNPHPLVNAPAHGPAPGAALRGSGATRGCRRPTHGASSSPPASPTPHGRAWDRHPTR